MTSSVPLSKAKVLAELELRMREQRQQAVQPTHRDWSEWLRERLPDVASAPFAPRHTALWHWFDALSSGERPAPRVEVWPRGGAKSATVELACGWLASKQPLPRRFVLYVSATQALANAHVQSIAGILEQVGIDRAVNKYAHSKGWTQQRLRASTGFNVAAFGLDAAQRGIKLDQYRPDLIVLDDIDQKHDTPETTAKKIATITTSILPAGSTDCAIVFIQNMILPDGIAAQLANGTADFLHDRDVATVEPAINGLTYIAEPRTNGLTQYRITGGTPTWAGQDVAVCERQINSWGLSAFLQEAQHDVTDPVDGLFGSLIFQHCDWVDVPTLEDIGVWCDPAVTNTDHSDANGIHADGRGVDGKIYRLWSWEQRATPLDTLCRALLKAVELKASHVGIETDQGGDTWQSVYNEAWRTLLDSGRVTADTRQPAFRSAKAGAGHGPKAERGERMKAAYERGLFVHVRGTHETLERALRRYLRKKPYDLVDAAYWAWDATKQGSIGIFF